MKVFVQFGKDKLAVPCDGLMSIRDLASAALKRYKALINERGVNIKRLMLMPSESILYLEDPINTILEDKDLVVATFDEFDSLYLLSVTASTELKKECDRLFISKVTSLAGNDGYCSRQSMSSGLTSESPIDEIDCISDSSFVEPLAIKAEPLSISHLEMSSLGSTLPGSNPDPVPNKNNFPIRTATTPESLKKTTSPNSTHNCFRKPSPPLRRSKRKTLCAESSKLKDRSKVAPQPKPTVLVKKFECNVCQKIFGCSSHLIRHKLIHSNGNLFKCNFCRKFFNTAQQLNEHKLSHQKYFRCPVCLKTFSQLKSLKAHKLKMHPSIVDSLKCDICAKQLYNRGNLLRHRRSHFQERLHECKVCSRRFTSSKTLAQHSQTHNKIKLEENYKCNKCVKVFNTLSDLLSHKNRFHLVKKSVLVSLQCNICLKRFRRQSDYTRHTRYKHVHLDSVIQKTAQCHLCSKWFTTVSGLNKHKNYCKPPATTC